MKTSETKLLQKLTKLSTVQVHIHGRVHMLMFFNKSSHCDSFAFSECSTTDDMIQLETRQLEEGPGRRVHNEYSTLNGRWDTSFASNVRRQSI